VRERDLDSGVDLPRAVSFSRLLAGTRPELGWEILNVSTVAHGYYQYLSTRNFKDVT
jgi:hypothetical protein